MNYFILYFYVFILFYLINSSASKDIGRNHVNKQDHYSFLIQSARSTKTDTFPSNTDYSTSNTNNDSIISSSIQLKKWQVGRVSRKQYEVINMLCRNTKLLLANIEDATIPYKHSTTNVTHTIKNQEFSINSLPHPILQLSTPSYIEFYYLDEIDGHLERKETTTYKTMNLNENIKPIRVLRSKQFRNHKIILPSGPMFAFHANDPPYTQPRVTQAANKGRKRYQIRRFPLLDLKDYVNFDITSIPVIKTDVSTHKHITMNSSVKATKTNKNELLASNKIIGKKSKSYTYSMSTANDKIKFFELYDMHTPIPQRKNSASDEIYEVPNESEILNTDEKILLRHVDQSGHDNRDNHTNVKKHIIEKFPDYSHRKNDQKIFNENLLSLSALFNKTIIANITAAKNDFINLSKLAVKPTRKYEKESKNALWSDYPFAAVYIHESAQVHCDAAGISPHWLVAAGSCLSRYQKSPAGQGRSAFVAYCGDSWWQPERIAYVKYSLVHPRFHPHDKTRRQLYNIGLIQVVSSMASACTGWAPITLMSHQLATERDGSTAYALGWGLDRFDIRYSSPDLPKWPLKVYKGLISSDSCPGNIGHSKTKRSEKAGMKNVYCMALPPYNGEKNDPVHGGLLLVGENLFALYLQEERRPWGDQSAQYTGTWRLTPWVLDVAREPDDGESFMVEL